MSISHELKSDDLTDQLPQSVQATLGSLEDVMKDVASRAATNQRDLMQVDHVVTNLNTMVTDTNHNVEESVDGISQMAERLTTVAAHVEEVEAETGEVGHVAESSRSYAQKALGDITRIEEAIKGLDEKTRKVLGISSVIKEVADTTNMLALNASIEAARAGDYGRSFSVLAKEIRKLADQTREQAQNIVEDLDAVMRQLDLARTVSNQVGKSVEALNGVVTRSHDSFTAIGQVISDAAGQIAETAHLGEQQQEHMSRVAGTFNTLTKDFHQVAEQLNQITDHVKETALSMEYGYSELAEYKYQGMVPKARQAAERAAREAQEIMEAKIAAKLSQKSLVLSLGSYQPIEREGIRKLGHYFDVSAVTDRESLDPPKYQVPYEGVMEDDLNQMVQRYIEQDRTWILFSVVDLNGYVLACADVDRPALKGDPKLDDRNRFKRLLPHPSWVRGARTGLGERVEWLPNNLNRDELKTHGAGLKRPATPLSPMIQTYIRNNVTVMTLLSTPLYVADERFGAIMVAWQ